MCNILYWPESIVQLENSNSNVLVSVRSDTGTGSWSCLLLYIYGSKITFGPTSILMGRCLMYTCIELHMFVRKIKCLLRQRHGSHETENNIHICI